MRALRTTIVLASCGTLLLSACTSDGKPKATPTPTPTTASAAPSSSTTTAAPSPTSVAPKPKPKPRIVEPLTGITVAAVAKRPVLIVKIENSPDARPQTGLNGADLVVEELVEGGITRFAAMFHTSIPPTLGPVRSLRDVDIDIVGPTGGLLVASGGAGVVRNRVSRGAAQLVLPTNSGRWYYRSGSRVAPHNLYLNARGVLRVANRYHRTPPTKTYLPFASTVAQSTAVQYGRPAHTISLSFSQSANPRWTYVAGSHAWLRSEGSTPSRLTSGGQISARNVVVMRVTTRNAGYSDPAGNYVPRTVFTGSGNATVFSEGRQFQAWWVKKTPTSPIQLIARANHKQVYVAPGRTWLELLTTSGSMRVT